MDATTHALMNQEIPPQVVAALADKAHLSGWFHNPYAMLEPRNQTADAVATHIAEHYIELFTEALRKRGVMPFAGVEINFDAHRSDALPSDAWDDLDSDIPIASSAPETALAERQLVDRMRDIGGFLNAYRAHEELLHDPQHPEYQRHYAYIKQHKPPIIQNAECRALLDMLDTQPILKEKSIEALHKHILNEASVDVEWKRNFIDFADALLGKAKSYRGGIFHNPMAKWSGVYVDGGNVEVCTPVLSPAETVKLVNFYKRIFFEASAEFVHELEQKGISQDEAHALRHDLAQWIRSAVDSFTLTYSLGREASGEHLSLSLQHDPHRTKDYAFLPDPVHTDSNSTEFARHNMTQRLSWLHLVDGVLQQWLPSDRILTVGHDSSHMTEFSTQGSRIGRANSEIEGVQVNTQDRQRVETRNFGDSGSNVALVMLGQLACVYAAVTALDPRVLQNPMTLDEEEVARVTQQLTYLKHHTDIIRPDSYETMKDAFKRQGMTLDMMKQVAEESAQGQDELEGLLKQRRQFEDAVCQRAASIMKVAPQQGRS